MVTTRNGTTQIIPQTPDNNDNNNMVEEKIVKDISSVRTYLAENIDENATNHHDNNDNKMTTILPMAHTKTLRANLKELNIKRITMETKYPYFEFMLLVKRLHSYSNILEIVSVCTTKHSSESAVSLEENKQTILSYMNMEEHCNI